MHYELSHVVYEAATVTAHEVSNIPHFFKCSVFKVHLFFFEFSVWTKDYRITKNGLKMDVGVNSHYVYYKTSYNSA